MYTDGNEERDVSMACNTGKHSDNLFSGAGAGVIAMFAMFLIVLVLIGVFAFRENAAKAECATPIVRGLVLDGVNLDAASWLAKKQC